MKLVHFYLRIEITEPKTGNQLVIKSMYKHPWQSNIELSTQFASDGNPSTSDISIHYLSTESSQMIAKNGTVDVYGGWYNSNNTQQHVAHITSGTIKTIQPNYNANNDIVTQFSIQDGTTYDNIKAIKINEVREVRRRASGRLSSDGALKSAHHQMAIYRKSQEDEFKQWEKTQRAGGKHISRSVSHTRRNQMKKNIQSKQAKLGLSQSRANSKRSKQLTKQKKIVKKFLSFKKNTKALTIIKVLAEKAGIKIHKINLQENKNYKNGYTANKKPMVCIKEIVKDCNSALYYPHGQLVIGKIKNTKIDYVANYETGLIQTPQLQTDASQSDTYNVQMVLNPEITTGTIFKVESEYLNGDVIVLSGSHSYSTGSTPTTEVSVQLLSAYQEAKAKKAAAEKKKAAKEKASKAKDAKKKAAKKAKQKQRQKTRKSKK